MINFLYRSFFLFFLALGSAFAANIPFEQAQFDQLLHQGKPVVLHIHADWCPTCRAQQAVLDDLMPLPEFRNLPVLRVNFDSEKSLLRTYKVRNQSTFTVCCQTKLSRSHQSAFFSKSAMASLSVSPVDRVTSLPFLNTMKVL